MADRFEFIGVSFDKIVLAQVVEADETMNEEELSSIGLQVYKPSGGFFSTVLSLSSSDARSVFRHARGYANALADNTTPASKFEEDAQTELSLNLGGFIYRAKRDGELDINLKTTDEGNADRLEIITKQRSVDISSEIIEWWEAGVLQEIAENPKPFLELILRM